MKLLQCCLDIAEKILRKSLISYVFCVLEKEQILEKILLTHGSTLCIPIIVKYSWGYSRRCKFARSSVEIMCLIEKLRDFWYIPSLIPVFSERWVYDSMPYLDICRLWSICREDISQCFLIVAKSLIIEINIWVQARESLSCFFYDRKRNISDEDSTDKTPDTISPISLVVEFLILCCYRSGKSILICNDDIGSSMRKISLYISRIALHLGSQFTVCSLIDKNRDDIILTAIESSYRIEKIYMDRL